MKRKSTSVLWMCRLLGLRLAWPLSFCAIGVTAMLTKARSGAFRVAGPLVTFPLAVLGWLRWGGAMAALLGRPLHRPGVAVSVADKPAAHLIHLGLVIWPLR